MMWCINGETCVEILLVILVVLMPVNWESCIMVYGLWSIIGEPRSYGDGSGTSSYSQFWGISEAVPMALIVICCPPVPRGNLILWWGWMSKMNLSVHIWYHMYVELVLSIFHKCTFVLIIIDVFLDENT